LNDERLLGVEGALQPVSEFDKASVLHGVLRRSFRPWGSRSLISGLQGARTVRQLARPPERAAAPGRRCQAAEGGLRCSVGRPAPGGVRGVAAGMW